MANNPILDRYMLEAAEAAYHVAVVNPDGVPQWTLTGSDPNGDAYAVDANGIITGTALAGFAIEAAFINPLTGFKAIALVGPDNVRILAFAGTEDLQDGAANVQLGWNQWTGDRTPGANGETGVMAYLRAHVLGQMGTEPIYLVT